MRKYPFILSLFLALPLVFFLIHHYFYHSSDLKPTGFTVDENVLYMSYAHQYLDEPSSGLFYSNPFDGDPSSPDIYFQPAILLFSLFLKMGADPGLILSLWGLICAIGCIYTGVLIIRHIIGETKELPLISLLFTWGGGLTALAGICTWIFLPGNNYQSGADAIYIADPANGWWGLNWGRNLFIPLESWYHFLFLLNILFILRNKWVAGLIISLILSISHPFTGIELLLILIGWLTIEKAVFKNKKIPVYYLTGSVLITLFHCWYYLIFLNKFPAHQVLFAQYTASWTYSLRIAIAAYILVLIMSIVTISRFKKGLLSIPHQRLFICWALVSFLLSKHEWFIKPMQPIHFTRGYIWSGLFLFSIPTLKWLIKTLQNKHKPILITFLIILLLNDNILWTVNLLRKKETVEWEGHLKTQTISVINFLRLNTSRDNLIIGNASLVNYMANVYSPANAWISHPYNTPDIEVRRKKLFDFFETGIKPNEWEGRKILLIIDKTGPEFNIPTSVKGAKLLFQNSRYQIFSL